MNPRLKNILALEGEKRYKFVLTETIECEEIWTLHDGDKVVVYEDKQGRKAIPVWTEKNIADMYVKDEWHKAEAVDYSLDELFYDLIPMLIDNHALIYVFPDLSFTT